MIMDTPSKKRKRTEISVAVKKALCQFKKQNPKCSQDRAAQFIKETYDVSIGRSTVSDILKCSEKWLNYDCESRSEEKATRVTQPRHCQLEDALFMWFTNAEAHNLAMSDELLCLKAKELGDQLDIKDLAYSRGWLCNFKKRRGIKLRERHGESASVCAESVESGRDKLKELLKDYQLKDIYNMDETGLFFRLEPNKTLASKTVKGTKKSKDRISVGLCANADGTDKLPPVVICKAKKPRCFNGFTPSTFVDYYWNKKAWMTSTIFCDFIEKLERKMRLQKRKILLLIDNAPSHITRDLELRFVRVEFLPPNTTSEIQPMDAGVIRNFKVHYKRHFLKHQLNMFDQDGSTEKINVKQAIYFIHDAWKDVKPTTIANCWTHTGILPSTDKDSETDVELPDTSQAEEELRTLMTSLEIPDPVTLDEYINIDSHEPTEELLTDSTILSLVTGTTTADTDSEEEAEPELAPKPRMSVKRAVDGMNNGLEFMEQHQDFTADEIDFMRGLINKVSAKSSKRQVDLFSFFGQ